MGALENHDPQNLGRKLALAREVFKAQYFQPATALWRVFETEIVQDNLHGRGRGLDLGCGDGRLARVLFKHLPDLAWTGLDIDAEDVAIARQMNVYQQFHIAPGDKIPEADNSFDLIFSNSVLEHIPPLDAVLGEVFRVLKPGGKFVITVPLTCLHDNLLWPRLLRFFGLQGWAEKYLTHLDHRLAHINYLSAPEWQEKMRQHGFTPEQETLYLSRLATSWWETLANATGGLVYLLLGRGRKTTRQLQHSTGMVNREHRWLGLVGYWLLMPVLLWTLTEKNMKHFSCLYLQCTK